MNRPKPLVLIILDGWGDSPAWGGNTMSRANTPNIDRFTAKYPKTSLAASSEDVGLPEGEMGNSEVGHLNIGAGRIIKQDVSKITQSIEDGDFFEKPALKKCIDHVLKNNSALHLAGLVSDGGIHSHIKHLFAILDFVKKQGIKKVFIHVFCDGRDTLPSSALSYVSKLKDKLDELGIGEIATVAGRYFAMDRDRRWERTEAQYKAMVEGSGIHEQDPLSCISHSYAHGATDEFIKPTVIMKNEKPVGLVSENDGLLFFNFRPDRMRQLLHAFADDKFKDFARTKIKNLYIVSMTPYEYELLDEDHIIFTIPADVKNCLSEVLSQNNIKQLHIAETEKYAHVTYFFNGGQEKPFPLEDRIMVQSPRVATYDLKPEMSALEITHKVIQNLQIYDFIVVNFANPDMVGHTGNMNATIKALQTVDQCLGQIVEEIHRLNGLAIITADHGNAEIMIDPVTSEPHTEHTTSPVFFILVDGEKSYKNLHPGKLSNIAPTILDILGIQKPVEMTENSLFEAPE